MHPNRSIQAASSSLGFQDLNSYLQMSKSGCRQFYKQTFFVFLLFVFFPMNVYETIQSTSFFRSLLIDNSWYLKLSTCSSVLNASFISSLLICIIFFHLSSLHVSFQTLWLSCRFFVIPLNNMISSAKGPLILYQQAQMFASSPCLLHRLWHLWKGLDSINHHVEF